MCRILFIIQFFIFYSFSTFSQSPIFREGEISFLDGKILKDEIRVFKKEGKYLLKLNQSNQIFRINEIKAYRIENRNFLVTNFENELLPVEILSKGKLSLYYLELENRFFLQSDGETYEIPKKYVLKFLQIFLSKSCDCGYLLNISQERLFDVYALSRIINQVNSLSESNFEAIDIGNRKFKSDRPSFGLALISAFNTTELYTRASSFKLDSYNSFFPGISITPFIKDRFRFNADIFFQSRTQNPNIMINETFLGELDGVETVTWEKYQNTNFIVSSNFIYEFQKSYSQKLIPSIFIGPIIGFFVGKNNMDFLRIIGGGFYEGSENNIHIDKELNFSALKAGISGGFGFRYRINQKLNLNSSVKPYFTYNYFNTDEVSMHLNEIDIGGLQMNEKNKGIQVKISIETSF